MTLHIRTSRSFYASISIDTGTAAIAKQGCFPSADDPMDLQHAITDGLLELPITTAEWAISRSGFGEGDYDVVVTSDEANDITAVEIVFESPAVEMLFEAELICKGLEPISSEEWRQYYDRSSSKAFRAEIDDRNQVLESLEQSLYNPLYKSHLPTVEPQAESSRCKLLTRLQVDDGTLILGDPGSPEPEVELEVVNGVWEIKSWHFDYGAQGERVVRLGAYLVP